MGMKHITKQENFNSHARVGRDIDLENVFEDIAISTHTPV